MTNVAKLSAVVAALVSLSGCETTAAGLSAVADAMAEQREQQQQQPQYRRPSDTSARGVR
jgi:hypothetical protein